MCNYLNPPDPSKRMPIFADNVVATSQPLAAIAGLNIIKAGGNALDAALATAITLTVVEPTSNGIGGDAFAIIWDGDYLHGINGSGRSPAAWTPEHFAKYHVMPEVGWDTVTIPGAISAWSALSERFGRLPFEDLFHSDVHYAREGFMVSPHIAHQWAQAQELYKDFPQFVETFLPGGKAPGPGDIFRCSQLAETLEKIAATGGETFYRGELAEQIVRHASNTGGSISREDLENHQVEWVRPISKKYKNITVHEIPPNGQGLSALIALGILRHLKIESLPMDSADSIHLQVEAMKIAFAEAFQHIADSDYMHISIRDLLADGYLAERAKQIRMDRAINPETAFPIEGGTVYLTTADSDGMMVSYIQSNYLGFGSGIVIPETGISLHSRGLGFSLKPDHPNQVNGGKRPYHTIIPAFVTKNGQPIMSFGVMGGHMQPQGHVQMIIRIFDYGLNPQEALDAPRWHVGKDFTLAFERGIEIDVIKELEKRGHRIMDDKLPLGLFGGGQVIMKTEKGYCAASDPRKDGQAVGF
jgi:gamma-glutamyltranspeptidase/glutathione hydrolase